MVIVNWLKNKTYAARSLQVGIGKSSVGQSMAKGEKRCNVLGIIPSVSYQQFLRVYFLLSNEIT